MNTHINDGTEKMNSPNLWDQIVIKKIHFSLLLHMLCDLHVAPNFQDDHSTFSHRTVYYAVLGDFNFPESIVTIQKAITEGFFSLSLLMLSTESGYNFGA